MVEMSPSSLSLLAIFLRTLLMILPDLVLGRPGAACVERQLHRLDYHFKCILQIFLNF